MDTRSFRVLVSGSRDWEDKDSVRYYLDGLLDLADEEGWEITLVHGACPTGADSIADQWAMHRGINRERHPADWDTFGKFAGPKRNQEMVDSGIDAAAFFIKNKSRGSEGTLKMVEEKKIPHFIMRVDAINYDDD